MRRPTPLAILTVLTVTAACTPTSAQDPPARGARAQADPTQAPSHTPPSTPADEPEAQAPPAPDEVSRDTLTATYPWLAYTENTGPLTTLDQKFPTPEGFTRVDASKGSYAAYLRGLPLRTDRAEVRLYTGREVRMPSAGIIPLDLGKRDVHQCADSVIRLHAEWLWTSGKAMDASYHYTSGDVAKWADWRRGRPLRVKGREVVHVDARKAPNTHKAFRRYLTSVFMYASTRSLHRDATRVTEPASLAAGDFLLQSGAPGHVVMLLDVATHPDGRRVALIGQGFLPAREFHVIEGSRSTTVDGVWFVLPQDEGDVVATPTWAPFTMKQAWRFSS